MVGYYISTRDGFEFASETLEGARKANEMFPGAIYYCDGDTTTKVTTEEK